VKVAVFYVDMVKNWEVRKWDSKCEIRNK